MWIGGIGMGLNEVIQEFLIGNYHASHYLRCKAYDILSNNANIFAKK